MEFRIIKNIKILENYIIEVIFEDEIKKLYDLKPLFDRFNEFKVLKNKEEFNKVKIDKGGYGISWNEKVDL